MYLYSITTARPLKKLAQRDLLWHPQSLSFTVFLHKKGIRVDLGGTGTSGLRTNKQDGINHNVKLEAYKAQTGWWRCAWAALDLNTFFVIA